MPLVRRAVALAPVAILSVVPSGVAAPLEMTGDPRIDRPTFDR
jgi:hypothetical protein